MGAVTIFQRAGRAFRVDPSMRGHHVVYRTNESNRCPGCGRSQWYVGRQSAECGFCGTAVALAEAQWIGESGAAALAVNRHASHAEEQRRHARIPQRNRALQLLIDGSPTSFALGNISAGGLMGSGASLEPGARVHVRFEGGILVPAVVKWREGDYTGLAFETPVELDAQAD